MEKNATCVDVSSDMRVSVEGLSDDTPATGTTRDSFALASSFFEDEHRVITRVCGILDHPASQSVEGWQDLSLMPVSGYPRILMCAGGR